MIEAGQRLRDKRIKAKVSHTLMAHLLEVDPKTIDNWEKGRTRAGGAVEFAYDNIDLLQRSRLGKRTSWCNHPSGSIDLRLFDPDAPPRLVEMKDARMGDSGQIGARDLFAMAS